MVLYAPAITIGDGAFTNLCPIAPIVDELIGREGPLFPIFLSEPAQGIFQVLCNNVLTQSTLCPSIIGIVTGFTGLQGVVVSLVPTTKAVSIVPF